MLINLDALVTLFNRCADSAAVSRIFPAGSQGILGTFIRNVVLLPLTAHLIPSASSLAHPVPSSSPASPPCRGIIADITENKVAQMI